MSRSCKACKAYLAFEREKETGLCIPCLYGMDIIEEDPIPQSKEHKLIERLIIPAKKYAQMKTYCELAKGEISGLGEIKINSDDKTATLVSIALLPQHNTAASTDITAETLHDFTLKMAKRGKGLENWKVWWHTHYNFQTFWSGTDEDNIKNLTKFFKTYLISVELNQNGSTLARLDEKRTRYDIEIDIKNYDKYSNLKKDCAKQIRRMVKEPEITHPLYRLSTMRGGKYYDL